MKWVKINCCCTKKCKGTSALLTGAWSYHREILSGAGQVYHCRLYYVFIPTSHGD